MSSNQLPSSPNENRLYTRLITTIKIFQFIGYFIVGIYSIVIFSIFGQTFIFSGFNNILVFGSLIYVVIACIVIYIFTEVLIAIIDLLSRIERNTRSE